MAFDHVCFWIDKIGWQSTNAEIESKRHPGGTVQPYTEFYKCEICGQYVGFADGKKKARYFYHSSGEQNKECENRAAIYDNGSQITADSRSLPIRLRIKSADSCEFELGFLALEQRISASIQIEDAHHKLLGKYSTERIQSEGLTYLSVGNAVSNSYYVKLSPENRVLRELWPLKVEGIDIQEGAIFKAYRSVSGDIGTGRMLPYDADVVVGQQYYLLCPSTSFFPTGGEARKLSEFLYNCRRWYVYSVRALDFTKSIDAFFSKFHCRLTEHPVTVFPLWPPVIQKPFKILYGGKKVTFYQNSDNSGKIISKVFPDTGIRYLIKNDTNLSVFDIEPKERQQLLATGRAKVLRYTYLRKDELDEFTPVPCIKVTDKKGKDIAAGGASGLPEGQLLRIKTPFDGVVLIQEKGFVVEKRAIKADETTEIRNIQMGWTLTLLQGLDHIWTISFESPKQKLSQRDSEMASALKRCGGQTRLIPHTIGASANVLRDYPETKEWLRQCVREGQMSEKAYKLFVTYIRTLKREQMEKET